MRTDEKSKFGEFDVRDLVFVGRNLDPRYFRKIYSIEFKPGSAMAKFAFSVGRLRRDVFKNREWTLVSGCPVPTRLDNDEESLTPDSQRLIRNMFSKCLINPDADRMDLFACRLYMFRKNHPFMYSLIWIAVIPMLTGCSGAAIEHLIWLTTGHNLVQLGVLAGFLLYVLVFMLHSAYVGTVMHMLEWYEREYRISKEYGINY